MIRQTSDLGGSQQFAGFLTNGADSNPMVDIGEFYFGQQVKFSLLQTLILIEVMVSSSSKVIYTLSGIGIGILWFFTLLLKDDQVKRALAYLYPRLLMLSTMLLSVILLIKVYFANEQSDLNLVFLGIAFTSDNFLLMTDVIPLTCKYMMTGASAQQAEDKRKSVVPINDEEEEEEETWYAWFTKTFPIISRIQDGIALVTILLVTGISFIIILVHGILAAPITWAVNRFIMRSKIDRWERQVNRDRRGVMADYESSKVSQDAKKSATTAVNRAVFLFVSALLVDLEFLAIAIAMSEVSGATTVGGVPIGTNVTHC
jgi:hypothetical protein